MDITMLNTILEKHRKSKKPVNYTTCSRRHISDKMEILPKPYKYITVYDEEN